MSPIDPGVRFFPRGLFVHEKGEMPYEIPFGEIVSLRTEKLTFHEVSSILVTIGLAFSEGI